MTDDPKPPDPRLRLTVIQPPKRLVGGFDPLERQLERAQHLLAKCEQDIAQLEAMRTRLLAKVEALRTQILTGEDR